MTDREVVIAHLDDLRLFADVTVHPVVSPDNWNVYASLCDYIDQIKTEVEKLLKEQEAQEAVVHPEPSCEMEYITDCCCDLCGEQLIREDNFCRCCGKHIEWEDR